MIISFNNKTEQILKLKNNMTLFFCFIEEILKQYVILIQLLDKVIR